MGRPLMAFCAIHAVMVQPGSFLVPEALRAQLVAETRAAHPVFDGGDERRHRFFYFEDYAHLARQLYVAVWIHEGQRNAVAEAHAAESPAISNSEQCASPISVELETASSEHELTPTGMCF